MKQSETLNVNPWSFFWTNENNIKIPQSWRRAQKKKFRPFRIFRFLLSTITLPTAKDYNLISNRVISLKTHSKHSLKLQDPRHVLKPLFIFRSSFTACKIVRASLWKAKKILRLTPPLYRTRKG